MRSTAVVIALLLVAVAGPPAHATDVDTGAFSGTLYFPSYPCGLDCSGATYDGVVAGTLLGAMSASGPYTVSPDCTEWTYSLVGSMAGKAFSIHLDQIGLVMIAGGTLDGADLTVVAAAVPIDPPLGCVSEDLSSSMTEALSGVFLAIG